MAVQARQVDIRTHTIDQIVEWLGYTGCRIVDEHLAVVTTDEVNGEIYWDNSDPSNVGWAYRTKDDEGREESGTLDNLEDVFRVFDV